MDTTTSRPRIRLKPKADLRALRRGSPWVFDNELVLDRRTKALAPGTLAVLETPEREAFALVAVNPLSKITARVLDRDPDAEVDAAWFATRLTRALVLRDRLYETPFYRLLHSEGDGLSGLVIDRFGDLAVVQPNAAWVEAQLEALVAALVEVTGITTVIKSASGRARGLEGLDDQSGVLHGAAPTGPVPVEMNGATYLADVMGGQKTGLFFDQRENHRLAARFASGARVLDVFSHVGGFGLAALAGEAASVLCVDASEPALDLATRGAQAMGCADRIETRSADAFAALAELKGETFDLVVCDPPAFAPAKPALEAGLRAYEKVARLAAPLVTEGGVLCLCSCSGAVDAEAFRKASLRGVGRAGRHAVLLHAGGAGPDHPVLPQMSGSAYLKSLFLRL